MRAGTGFLGRNPLKSGQGFNFDPDDVLMMENDGRNPLKSGQGFNEKKIGSL